MYLHILTLLCLVASPLLAHPMEEASRRTLTPASPPAVRIPNALDASRGWICFEQRYAHRPLHVILSPDCESVLQQIENSDKVGAPMLFSRTTGYTVPHPMKVGTCAIILDINDTTPDKSVTVPMAVVIKAVRLILRMCVSLPPPPGIGMGGFTDLFAGRIRWDFGCYCYGEVLRA